MTRRSRCFAIALPFILIAASAQDRIAIIPRPHPARPAQPSSNIRLDVKLVLTPVSVTDPLERQVSGLRRSNFRIFEDDVPQEVSEFYLSDTPVSVGLVFDSSRSMKSRIADSRMAVEQFLRTSAPEDEFLLVKFATKPELLTPFTRDTSEISGLLGSPEAQGWTALVDAVCLATQKMRRASNPRKVLLIISDGADNNSRYSEGELMSLLREADVRVFAISLFQRPGYLEKIADETGGRVIWVHHLNELPEAMEVLSRQIRSEYVVGYLSKRAENDGRYHKIRVEVEPPAGSPPVRVSWRRGYIAPNE